MPKRWADAPREAAWRFFGYAAFPRVSHLVRWPTRLGPRGLLLYIAFNTVTLAALRTYLINHAAHRDRINAELAPLLATNPTRDQLDAYMRARWGG